MYTKNLNHYYNHVVYTVCPFFFSFSITAFVASKALSEPLTLRLECLVEDVFLLAVPTDEDTSALPRDDGSMYLRPNGVRREELPHTLLGAW